MRDNIRMSRDDAEYLIDLMDADKDFCPQWHELYKHIADRFGMRNAKRISEINKRLFGKL